MNFLNFCVQISFILIGISLILVFLRILVGPSNEDRIVALDLFTANGIAFFSVYSLFYMNNIFIDIGLIMALIAFLGTIAYAYYLERRLLK